MRLRRCTSRQASEPLTPDPNPNPTPASLKPLIFDQDELDAKPEGYTFTASDDLSQWLNIASVFLTAVNYYVTVPTTNAYAEALGVDASYR